MQTGHPRPVFVDESEGVRRQSAMTEVIAQKNVYVWDYTSGRGEKLTWAYNQPENCCKFTIEQTSGARARSPTVVALALKRSSGLIAPTTSVVPLPTLATTDSGYQPAALWKDWP